MTFDERLEIGGPQLNIAATGVVERIVENNDRRPSRDDLTAEQWRGVVQYDDVRWCSEPAAQVRDDGKPDRKAR